MVCAGTGSGKTKAFYVPAFLRIAPELADLIDSMTTEEVTLTVTSDVAMEKIEPYED